METFIIAGAQATTSVGILNFFVQIWMSTAIVPKVDMLASVIDIIIAPATNQQYQPSSFLMAMIVFYLL